MRWFVVLLVRLLQLSLLHFQSTGATRCSGPQAVARELPTALRQSPVVPGVGCKAAREVALAVAERNSA